MTQSRRRKKSVPKNAVVIVARDMVRSIFEGETNIVDGIIQMAAKNDIVILKSCICEGLKESSPIKVEGLHAIGRLLSVSQIVSFSPEEDDRLQGKKRAFVTADALLSYLIGPLARTGKFKTLLGQLWLNGVVPMTRDVDLFAAFACVREGDEIYPSELARAVNFSQNLEI